MKILLNPAIQKVNNNLYKKTKNNYPILSSKLPSIKTPMVSYLIQKESDFKNFIEEKILNNKYIFPEQKSTYDIITFLEKKKIILPEELTSESPRFNNNILTDDAYEKIVDKIADTNTLTNAQKKTYIDKLANNNNKSYKPPAFKGENFDSITDISDIATTGASEILTDPDLVINDGLDLIDVTLPEDLQQFLHQNPIEISDGFFDSLSDILVDGVEGLKDVFDNIQDFMEKLGDFI